MGREGALWLLLAVGGALAVIALARPDLLAGGRGVNLLYLGLLLAYMGGAVWAGARMDMSRTLLQAVIWVAAFVVLASGWRLWQAWT